MNVAKEALKYGMAVLDVTPKELHSLIESSKDYEGEDYKRWLAGQIIKVAEKSGVGYSQLLAKWFNIISEIEEESSDMTLSPRWVSHISSLVDGCLVYSVGMGMEDFGPDLSEVEWFNGLDIPWNTWFTDEKLPEPLVSAIHGGEEVALVVNLGCKLPMKKADSLVQDAKRNGIPCTSSGAVMLYRLCNMLAAMEHPEMFRVVLMSDTKFWLNSENNEVIRYFLSHFAYTGLVVNSKDLYNSAYTSEDYSIVSCCVRSAAFLQDGIVLHKVAGGNTDGERRYSCGGNMYARVFEEEPQGKVLGYICQSDNMQTAVLSSSPVDGCKCVAITMSNLEDVIGYYGVTTALNSFGLHCDIPELLSGHPEYPALISNCVPVFLFGLDSKFCNQDNIENAFDVTTGTLAASMLDKASQHFGYETKELVEVCKGFLDYLSNKGVSVGGKTFSEIRSLAGNSELNSTYITALNRCLGYICTQYRRL